MKKYLICSLIFALAGCASKPKEEPLVREAPTPVHVTEAPKKKETPPPPPVVARPQAPIVSGQYAGLNEGIKDQNDEKIFQEATSLLAQNSNDIRSLNALAMYHYKRGRFDLCRYLLNRAIGASPKTAELYSNLGVVQLAQGEQREAVKSFRKALEINGSEPVAASNLGAIYTQVKDYGKAQVVLDIAYNKGIRDERVLNNYAITLTAQGKYNRAEEIYKTLIEKKNNSSEYLYNYAILLVDYLGKYQEGIEVINRLKFVGGPADTRNRIIALENKAKAGLK